MIRRVKRELERLLLLNLMFTTPEGRLWCHNTRDPEFWELYLWTRRN